VFESLPESFSAKASSSVTIKKINPAGMNALQKSIQKVGIIEPPASEN